MLPSNDVVQRFVERMSQVATSTYTFDELVQEAIWTLTVRDKDRITLRAASLNADVAKRCPLDDDITANIVSNAWFELTSGLFNIYDTYRLWDQHGQCNYYFKRLTRYDIVIAQLQGES